MFGRQYLTKQGLGLGTNGFPDLLGSAYAQGGLAAEDVPVYLLSKASIP